ncbi:DNA-3-methyladenine glycosylase I [Acinetobacter sp. c3-l95]|uniref:DNA-3-methyladenine glycosylase I n=1 Tax=Acinetobacter sp. c3-l95 TaxID=3342804 RepID=UPI0035BB7164
MNQQTNIVRCAWVSDDELYQAYHDHEWGKPVHDGQQLFEMLCLEGQQAGLSWITVLKKQECYRQHFFQYAIAEIAQMTDDDLQAKMSDAGLIRHFAKLKAIRDNAIAWQAMRASGVDMVAWLWQFVDGKIINRDVKSMADVPTQTEQSQAMAKALKKHGFKFMGATTCYAFMQAVGMVNDHANDCWCKR